VGPCAGLGRSLLLNDCSHADNWIYHYFEVDQAMIDAHVNLKFEILRYTGAYQPKEGRDCLVL
jgi:hypothetical protein